MCDRERFSLQVYLRFYIKGGLFGSYGDLVKVYIVRGGRTFVSTELGVFRSNRRITWLGSSTSLSRSKLL